MCHKCHCGGAGLAAFVFGVLAGAAAGAAAGLLFAPAKGETTRRKLKKLASDAYEDQKEFILEHAGDLKEKVKERADEMREKISEKASDVRERLADGKEKVAKEFAAKFKKEEDK